MMKIDSVQSSWLATGNNLASDTSARQPLGIERSSGSWCPQTGMWQTTNITASAVVGVQKGTMMPWHHGQSANWRLVSYDYTSEDAAS